MQAIGIIPARLGSTRLPEKMLIKINDKPLIQLTYENALKSKKLSKIIVATDDQKIADVIEAINGNVVLTDKSHTSGTSRIAEVAAKNPADVYVNIQGDEPCLDPGDIDKLVDSFSDSNVDISTLAHKINKQEAQSPDNVKVVMDNNNFALYFSRSVIPYDRDDSGFDNYYKHIGVYGYKQDILFEYVKRAETELENVEKLEQLKALFYGWKIKVVCTSNETLGVDVKEDLMKLRIYDKNVISET